VEERDGCLTVRDGDPAVAGHVVDPRHADPSVVRLRRRPRRDGRRRGPVGGPLLSALADECILYDRQSPITERTLACLLDEGVFPRVAAEIDHLEALKNLVRMGVGVSVVPRWSALRELAAGALSAVSVASPRMPRLWGLCYLDGQHSAPIRALLEVCAESLPRRLAQGAVGADELRRPEAG
jgi:DNA-binding transcriptional LysR family regulator